jgi:predicted nucleic acid-binding protein
MGTKYIVDTNVLIDYLGDLLPNNTANKIEIALQNNELFISVVNKIEVLSFNELTEDESIKIRLFLSLFNQIKITDGVVEQTINIRKKFKVKLPDAIIAATALEYDLILLTRNIKDFNKIDGINIIDSYKE